MATQQDPNTSSDNNSLSISPGLVVGIVIIAAFFCVIVFASLYRFCSRRNDSNGLSSMAFAAHDADGLAINPDADFWNPNRQRSAAQVARMKEVRWINNMYAWERGRQARLEAGEIKRTTMIAGRRGENKSWDEYTVDEDSSGRDVSCNSRANSSVLIVSKSAGNTSGEHAGGQFFYNADNLNGRFPSHQRLSHLAPSTNGGRASYLSSGNGNALLPRQPSALLPPSIQEHPRTAIRRSPPRNQYQAQTRVQEMRSYPEGAAVPGLRMVDSEPVSTQPRILNPKITVNDQTEDVSGLRSPEYAEDTNFETVSLHDDSSSGGRSTRGAVGGDTSLPNFSRPREGHNVTPTNRPSVIVTDGSLPQLQLHFATPPTRAQHAVSSIYEEDVVMNSPDERQGMHTHYHAREESDPLTGRKVESLEEYGEEVGGEIPKENVKDMISEWERVNGRFAR